MPCSICGGIARHYHVFHSLILGEPGVVACNLAACGINSGYMIVSYLSHPFLKASLTAEGSPKEESVGNHVPAATAALYVRQLGSASA